MGSIRRLLLSPSSEAGCCPYQPYSSNQVVIVTNRVFNVNATISQAGGVVGSGFLIRNHRGEVIALVMDREMAIMHDSKGCGALGNLCWKTFSLDVRFNQVLWESNSLQAVNLINGDSGSLVMEENIVEDVKRSIPFMSNFSCNYCLRRGQQIM